MKSTSRSSIFALAVGLLASVSASAAPFQLGILGNLRVDSNSVDFGLGTSFDGGAYSDVGGTGSFTVAQLDSSDVFGLLGISKGQTGAIRSFSTLGSATTPPFMSFTGSDVTMTGSVPVSGDLGPFFLQDTAFGAIASFNVFGNLLKGTTVLGTYQGVFTATFNGFSKAQLISILNEAPTGLQVPTTYAATFTSDADVTVSAVTPEPSTLILIGLPLLGIGLLSRRRKIKFPRALPKILMTLTAVSLMSVPASADLLKIGGNLQVGPDFIDFGAGTNSDGGPYVDSGTGVFTVMQLFNSPFSAAGISLGQTGTIKSFSTSTLSVVPPFMTFDGGTVSMTASTPIGPFFLQDTSFGAVGSFNVAGFLVSGGNNVGPYTGTFSATFIGITAAELTSQIITDKVVISTPFVATFDAIFTPEPGTLAITGAGLAALVALRRRRASR